MKMKKRIGKVGKVGLNVVMRLNKRVAAIKSHAKQLEKSFINEVKRRKVTEFEREDNKEISSCFANKAEWLFCQLMAYNGKGDGISKDELKTILHDYNLFNGKLSMEYETKKKAKLKEKDIESSFYYNYGILANM